MEQIRRRKVEKKREKESGCGEKEWRGKKEGDTVEKVWVNERGLVGRSVGERRGEEEDEGGFLKNVTNA